MSRLYFSAVDHINQAEGTAFNIGGGLANSLSLLELLHLLEQLTDIGLSYVHIAPRSSDQKVMVANITKAKHILRWEPAVPAHLGLSEMVNWVESV